MGAFQAVASGLGETGEQMGQGLNQALNEALRVQAQQHLFSMDQAHLDLAKALQQQTYQIAQQQHELTRQQILQSGWKDLGIQVDPSTGQYTRTFYNEQTGEKRPLPVNGTPPDSPQAMVSYYKNLKGMEDGSGSPLFTDLQAKQIAFKMPNLYREGPVGMMSGFRDYADELASSGVSKIKSSTGKMLDISTPAGKQAFAQDQLDLIYGRSGFFRYGSAFGMGGGKPIDQSGWTANEQREYKGLADQIDRMEQVYTKMAQAQMANLLDPTQQAQVTQNLIATLEPMYAQLKAKQDEISARHGRGNPPAPGAKWSKGAWAAANPGKDANAAEAQARAQGATVTP